MIWQRGGGGGGGGRRWGEGGGGGGGRGVAKLHLVGAFFGGAFFGGGLFWWEPFLVGAPCHVSSLPCPKSGPACSEVNQRMWNNISYTVKLDV